MCISALLFFKNYYNEIVFHKYSTVDYIFDKKTFSKNIPYYYYYRIIYYHFIHNKCHIMCKLNDH